MPQVWPLMDRDERRASLQGAFDDWLEQHGVPFDKENVLGRRFWLEAVDQVQYKMPDQTKVWIPRYRVVERGSPDGYGDAHFVASGSLFEPGRHYSTVIPGAYTEKARAESSALEQAALQREAFIKEMEQNVSPMFPFVR